MVLFDSCGLCSKWKKGKAEPRGDGGQGGDGGGGEHQRRRRRRETHASNDPSASIFISFAALRDATNDFSSDNHLGRGGFGNVFKGLMPDGQRIAVKKLSLNSRQGAAEFVNEVKLLLKVQHRNLVSLLGCCAEGSEKMLVYEYLPNGSLDRLLFDKTKSAALDWPARFKIIMGIAKGLLYLHEESPVKIIHRDIKASNILLDQKMNPKISDFGLARLFKQDDTHMDTFRISGTYGYMAPEYAITGYLSVKTDVFSYGVLVLEIVSGRKNLDHRLNEEKSDLLSYAWNLSEKGNILELVDPNADACDDSEAALCIRIGLLCCQATVADRPDMSAIRLMLSSNSFSLPKPGKPGLRGRAVDWTTSSSHHPSITNSTATTGTNSTATGSTSAIKPYNAYNIAEDYSRNSISVSFTTEGR